MEEWRCVKNGMNFTARCVKAVPAPVLYSMISLMRPSPPLGTAVDSVQRMVRPVKNIIQDPHHAI
jgi:hypothetical protein